MTKSKGFNKILLAIIKYLWLGLIVIGGLLFFAPECGTYINISENYAHELGAVILTSGIIGGLVKSLQFAGVFKEELEKVIEGDSMSGVLKTKFNESNDVLKTQLRESNNDKLNKGELEEELSVMLLETKHLENRADLLDIWKRISKLIHDKKFPAIRDDLGELVLESYFPEKHDYYFEDFDVQILIDSISDDMYIKYTEILNFTVIMEKGKTNALIGYSVNNDKSTKHPISTVLKETYVDGEKIKIDEDVETLGESTKVSFKVALSGKEKYNVKFHFEKTDSLIDSNYLIIRTNRITRRMHFTVDYPESVNVSFFNIGLINKFEIRPSPKNRIVRRHESGLILPQQGVGLSFQRSSVKN